MSYYGSIDELTGLLGGTPAPLVTQAQKQAVKDRDNAEKKRVAQETWDEFMDEDANEDAPIENLIDHIKTGFRDAEQARMVACVDENIITSRRLVAGEYTMQELALMPEIDAWYPVAGPISGIALAFLRSILQGDEDNPVWELRGSPIPELPKFIVDRAEEFAALKVQQEALTSGVEMTEERAVEIVLELRDELFETLERQSDLQIRNLQKEIAQIFSTGNFYEVLDEFLQAIVVDPTACIKGPVVSSKKQKEWDDTGNLTFPHRKYQHYEAIDILDLYPSPDSADTQTGTFIIHKKKMTRKQLCEAQSMKGFIPSNIELLLLEYEERSRDWLAATATETAVAPFEYKAGKWRDYEGVDVLEYHGQVPGHVLIKSNVTQLDGEQVDELKSYEMEVWMTCDHIIRVVECCNPSGRPFFCASLYPNKNSIWGESIPLRIEDEQRAANASLRAALRDMGYTSGPQVQVDVSFLDKNQKIPKRFAAGTVTKVNSRQRGAQGKAITFEQLITQSPTFMAQANQHFQNAELNSGFNRQMLGQSQPGISTLGEANILQGNAVTGLRSMLVPIDRVIEGIVEMTACQVITTTEDPMLKADATPVAKGSSHLLDRQLNKQNALQLFTTFYPVSQSSPGLIEPFAMACLVREIASANGYDPDKFAKDPNSVEARNEQMLLRRQELGLQEGGSPGIAGGASQPPQTLSPLTAPSQGAVAGPGV